MERLEKEERNKNLRFWLRRLGWMGVLFFFVKGLLWLAVFFGLGKILGL